MGAMAGAPTFQELYDIGKAESLIRRPSITFKPGDVSDMVLGGAAAIGDRVIGYVADRFKATYVDGARGADLTTLADDHWGIVRVAAVKASGQVTITRSSATVNPFTLPAGSILATIRDSQGNEVRFVTLAPASWAASTNGARTVAAEAEVAGVGGNVAAAKVTRIISTTLDGTYVATNAAPFTLGAAEESDADLRERIRQYPSTLRRGTLAALEYGAKQVPGVKYASAVEDGTGGVNIYVTDSSGVATGTPTTCAPSVTDLGTTTTKVAVELESWRAAGSLVTVNAGQVLSVDIAVTLTVRAGVDVAQLITYVTNAISARVALLKIGETLYRSAVQAVIRNVDPVNIVEAGVTMRTGANPYASVDIAVQFPYQILRGGSVTVA